MTVPEKALAEAVAANLVQVRERVSAACDRAGRPPDAVRLVAASKTRSPAEVLAALAGGVRDFGENRPEEAVDKMAAVDRAARDSGLEPPLWHMIGHVQGRKAKLVAGRYSLMHSLDSLRLGQRLSRLASEAGTVQDCLVQVNVSGEASKEGYLAADEDGRVPSALLDDCRALQELPGIRLAGLMTIPPIADDVETARRYFRRLRVLRDSLAGSMPDVDWGELSMGMTDDFEAAILEGATLVRIGRAIFGPRTK